MFGFISKAAAAEKSAAVDDAIDRQAAARAQRKRDDEAADRLSRDRDAPRGGVHATPAPSGLRLVRGTGSR